jgi:hypothetical protein
MKKPKFVLTIVALATLLPGLLFAGPVITTGPLHEQGTDTGTTATSWTIDSDGNSFNITITADGASMDGPLIEPLRHVSEKSDDYSVTTNDLGKTFRMNSGLAKTFSLPSMSASYNGARLTFMKLGLGRMTIEANGTNYIYRSTAGGTIYTESDYATITLEYCHTNTRWYIVSAVGIFTTT